jgi:tetratricopeptide (TPR) repeat protein
MASQNANSGSGPEPDKLAAKLADALSDEAREYLREQTELTRLQKQNLIEQNAFELSHLRWRRAAEWMSGVLRICLVFIGLLAVIAIGVAIWSAARDNGLTIEAFSVPPDLAQKGVTGEVMANKVLDRLSDFQRKTISVRAASSYADNWGDDIKVQIPNTGVSIGEMNRYLHEWLGHGTRISGEVYRTADGAIAVTARVGAEASPTFTGKEADLDRLVEQAAEAIYRVTQPYRYGMYLAQYGRHKEARAVFTALAENGPGDEKLWGRMGLRWEYNAEGREDLAARELRGILAEHPDFRLAAVDLAPDETNLGHEEAALAASRYSVSHTKADRSLSAGSMEAWAAGDQATIQSLTGDYLAALRSYERAIAVTPVYSDAENMRGNVIAICGALHDVACRRNALASFPPARSDGDLLFRKTNIAFAEYEMGHFSAAREPIASALKQLGDVISMKSVIERGMKPTLAVIDAHLGNFRSAHALIDTSPLDCSPCLRMRGTIAGLEKNWAAADDWFARAVKAAPSIPFNETDWGAMLMRKGDLDGAIAKFEIASRKGPRFADPLEMWGEALIAKNRSDLALAKFEQANRYAPNWGRLHLKWGEALLWSGDKDGAEAAFARAKKLDLTSAERQELAKALP